MVGQKKKESEISHFSSKIWNLSKNHIICKTKYPTIIEIISYYTKTHSSSFLREQ